MYEVSGVFNKLVHLKQITDGSLHGRQFLQLFSKKYWHFNTVWSLDHNLHVFKTILKK